MKRYTLLSLLLLSLFGAASAQQNITLRIDRMPVTEAIGQIESQTGYRFSYNPDLIKEMPPASIQLQNADIQEALEALFGKTHIRFVVRNKHIVLKKRPENITISGYIYDAKSRETLIAANIFDQYSQHGTVSNNFGFFSLTLPPQKVLLRISYVGYDTYNTTFTANNDTAIVFSLQPSPLLQEVVVEGRQAAPFRNVESGKITLNAQTLQAIPSFMGEKDVVKTLQLMPGVAAGTEGVAGMYVRGGNLDENLYLVDGNPLYHINHLGGIFSAFNPEAVKTMDFYKGSFPARYGGRLSSVVDVRMNDGSLHRFSGTASVGLISSRVHLQGPIAKDRTSFSLSFRRTYLDLIMRPAIYLTNKKAKKENPHNYELPDAAYYFYDFNAKINHRLSDRSRLYLSLYDGKDKLFLDMHTRSSFAYNLTPTPHNSGNATFKTHSETNESKTDFDMGWGTRMASLNWTCALSNKLFSNATLIYSRYASDIRSELTTQSNIVIRKENSDETKTEYYEENLKTTYGSGIEDIGYRFEFDYSPANNHSVRFGTSLLNHFFRPEQSRITNLFREQQEERSDTLIFADERIRVKELSLYAEDEIDFGKRLRVNAGIHLSGFFVQGKSYISAQPRLSARYLIADEWSLKASYGKMNQYVHLLQSSHISLPNDLWVPITKNIKPMASHQISAGVSGRSRGFDLSLETYYKSSENQVEYKENIQPFMGNLNWEERIAQGLSKSYGVEAMAARTFGSTSGWLGYTLAWSNRHFPNGEINRGRPYPAKYDNRHKINAVVMHRFGSRFDASASWIFSSGNRTTLSAQNFLDETGTENYYIEKRNNFKMPDYHRLDLSFNFYRPKKNGRMGVWNVSIYNAYSHHNSFVVVPSTEAEFFTPEERKNSNRPLYKSISIFPVIPSVSYTYKF